MTTQTRPSVAKARRNAEQSDDGQVKSIRIKPIARERYRFAIVGTSPLIQHQWSEKAKQQMREKQGGRKTKTREPRNIEVEAAAAAYRTAKNEFGIPVSALKKAIIDAAHKDLGVSKVLVSRALFIETDDPGLVIPMECSEPVIREDPVRVGMLQSDLRYRPEFTEWRVPITVEIDSELLQPEDLANLVDRAGFGVGIGEWRPQMKGDYGRFELDRSTPMERL